MVGGGTGGRERVGRAEELVETEDGKGVEGWLDPGDRYLDCRVVVGSWTDWGWAEGVKQMGMGRVKLVGIHAGGGGYGGVDVGRISGS